MGEAPARPSALGTAIGRRAKILALVSLAAGAVLTYWTLGTPYYWISLAVLAITGSWIATRPE